MPKTEQERIEELAEAIETIVEAWDGGGLAAAVNDARMLVEEKPMAESPARAVVIEAEETVPLLALAQDAANAANGDSNDEEIETLRDALEYALGLLGLEMPEAEEES